MPQLLFHKKTRPTGRVLAQALGITGSTTPVRNGRETIVRWGSRVHIPGSNNVLNSANAIATASNKLLSLRVMDEAGVRVPKYSTDPTSLRLPVLGRRTQHSRGTDIVPCESPRDWERKPRDYYTEYVPTAREFRIHVFKGNVIRVQGKYLDFPEQANPWIRNHKHGYRFRAPAKNLHSDRIEAATQAVAALGLDFGAVDLLVGEDGLAYVLEVNTAPACSPMTAEAWVRAFAGELGISEESLNLSALQALSTT